MVETISNSIRKSDIYEQYKTSLIAVNEFYFERTRGQYPARYRETQRALSFLGGMANHRILEDVEKTGNAADLKTMQEIKKLIENQTSFIQTKPPQGREQYMFYEQQKNIAMEILKGYDRQIVKWEIQE